jgi:phage terminase large subunit-like protein
LTLGPRVAEVSEQLGLPLMPWQRHVVDVALEIDPDTGLLAYREIILTVPRQSGKSTLILGVGTHRSLGFGPRQVIRYGAQTRNDARQKWEDDYVEILETTPLKRLFKVRKTNGNEAIMWNNRSRWGITSNTEKAGHGGTLDLAFLDEAFSQVDNRLEQAFKPAMVTRDNAQFWVVSTAGTDTSTYLKGKRDRGRKLVESGVTKGVAYFEWSAPDDAEPGDREVWRSCMPGLRCNGGIIKEDAIEADFQTMDLIEFQRAYLNQWPDRNAVEPVIPLSKWAPLADVASQVEDPVVFAVDANPERSAAAIAVAGRRETGWAHRGGRRPGGHRVAVEPDRPPERTAQPEGVDRRPGVVCGVAAAGVEGPRHRTGARHRPGDGPSVRRVLRGRGGEGRVPAPRPAAAELGPTRGPETRPE